MQHESKDRMIWINHFGKGTWMEFQGFRNRKMIYNLWVFRISMLIYWIEIRFTGKKVSIDSLTIIISSFTPTISWWINVNHPFPNSFPMSYGAPCCPSCSGAATARARAPISSCRGWTPPPNTAVSATVCMLTWAWMGPWEPWLQKTRRYCSW